MTQGRESGTHPLVNASSIISTTYTIMIYFTYKVCFSHYHEAYPQKKLSPTPKDYILKKKLHNKRHTI